MNPPRPAWIAYVYWAALAVSLLMLAATITFIASHCERVLESTGTPGACGLGLWWILFCAAYIAIAGYSAWEIHRLQKE